MGKWGKLLCVGVAALSFRACVLEPVKLTDDSMSPILVEGDVVFVSKLRYGLRVPGAGAMLVEWSKPQKGDIVVAVSAGDPPVNLMRRITAVPGDLVTLPDGRVAGLGPYEYFLLAEQKEGVMDSRRLGPVSRKAIVGKVTHTWFAKKPSTESGSGVESERLKWRILQPIL